jgi:hypothetical protein
MPKQEVPRKLPQYGLRNTVDLGGAAQKLEQSERNQRSWSAPPEGRTFEDHPKRCSNKEFSHLIKIASWVEVFLFYGYKISNLNLGGSSV